ncbi:mechanosensitive ion channel family protein [Nocardioides mangrovicus]|uniref:Mechanosensitive ion channel family protein n=1 Tax=Nocardioides mangrovicus TaxID=2478913 RepID=A0A3L8P087_9ACTN|nr:mechanosensitive ion channel family protein [Nocardioides mangrovicus]
MRRLEGRIELDLRRAVACSVVALVALAVGHELDRDHPTLDRLRVVSFGCALVVLVFGVAATRSASNEVSAKVTARAGSAAAAPLRVMLQVVGYLLVVVAVLDVVGVDLSQFLVGGAVTGVVIGIAAQQTLGNFFAGIVLLLARPYAAGDSITVYSGAINGPHTGTVTDVGLLYTSLRVPVLDAAPEIMRIPNSQLLAAGIGPGRDDLVRRPADEGEPPVDGGGD